MVAVTLKDIAARAGVSKSAISHVLNNRENFVSDETRKRILKIIKETNYQPDYLARSLRTQKTRTIGVLMTGLKLETVNDKIEAITNISWANDYNVIINCTRGDESKEEKYLNELRNRRVEGAIIVSPTQIMKEVSFFQKAIDDKYPLVFLDEMHGVDASYVTVDRSSVGRIAAKHLAKLGHKKVLYLKTSNISFREQDRFSGFLEGWESQSLHKKDIIVIQEIQTADEAKTSIRGILSKADRPTAVFGYDEHVLMAINVSKSLKLSIPEDIAIIGVDNLSWTANIDPPLTTIDYPKAEIGEAALNILMKLINNPDMAPVQKSMRPFLVIRESCGMNKSDES